MIVMEMSTVVLSAYLFKVSPDDHKLIQIWHYRPTAQLMKDRDRQE